MRKVVGTKSLKFGEPDATGVMPAVLASLFDTYRNTAEFIEDDPQISEEFADQYDDPVFVDMQPGSKVVKVSTFDYDNDVLMALKGGSVLDGQWYEPEKALPIYKAVELVSDTDVPFAWPKCRIFAKFNTKFVKGKLSLLEVVMKPEAPGNGKGATIIGSKTAP